MSLLSRGSLLQTTRLRPGFIPCWSLWPWCLIVSLMVWKVGFVVYLGMAFVDNWVVGKEKVSYWLSNDIVGLVGNLVV